MADREHEVVLFGATGFTGQLTALLLTALHLGQARGKLGDAASKSLMQELTRGAAQAAMR